MGKLNCSHNFLCHAEAFKGKDKIVGSWLIGCEAKIYTSFAYLNIWKILKMFFFLVFLIVVLNMNILSCIIIIQVINNCLKIDKGQ